MFGIYDIEGKKDLIAKIKQSDRRIKDKKQQLEDVQNELDLLKKQEFECCKRNISYFGFQNSNITEDANKWLHMLQEGKDKDGKKLDKRKKYDEKLRYEWLTDSIRRILGDDSIVIDEIIQYGMYAEAYDYVFTYNNMKHYIKIPIVAKVPFDDYDQFGVEHSFGINLYVYVKSCVCDYIGGSIFMSDIKDIWKKYTEKPEEVIGRDEE